MADPTGFIPPLSRWYELTTDYGEDIAAGPHKGEPHYALDFGAPWDEPVFSMAPGVVIAPNGNPEGVTGGNTITVDYGNGIIATYAHLNKMVVRPGDKIGRGQMIGTVGNTGITTGTGGTSGSHLHLDVWQDGNKINPLDLFDWTAEAINPEWYASRPGHVPIGGWDFDPKNIPVVGEAISVAESVGSFVAAVLNPATWARVAAMLLGFVMAMFGAYMIWTTT